MKKPASRHTPEFNPELSRGIVAILLGVLTLLIVLSFFDLAGAFGTMLDDWILSFLFGRLRYAVPAILLIFIWFVFKDDVYDYRPTHGIGAVLFFLTVSSLFHIGLLPQDMWRQALEGNGGGVFGMLAWPLKMYVGMVGSLTILIGLAAVSLLLLFNTAILHFLTLHRRVFAALGSFGYAVKNAFETPHENETGLADDFEEENADMENRRGFFRKHVGDDVEDEEAEKNALDNEMHDVEAADPKEPIGRVPQKQTTRATSNDAVPNWAKHAVIRPLPNISLLASQRSKPTSGDIKANGQTIQNTLKEFGIDVDMDDVRIGPTITQYSLRPSKGIKLTRITALSNDLALALAAHPIRIEAPIPGKSLVGVEVPNERAATVTLRELIESKACTEREHDLMIALGKDVGGKIWLADLPRMPHLLIAGATGSGKTACVNIILMSLLYQNTAQTLRFILVDPKRVELTVYNGIPHLLTPVITNTQQTVNALKWTTQEMDRRFDVLSRAGNRDIAGYNKKHSNEPLPHIVFVIDELADLMATAGNEVEAGIIRLAQMARAVGIHLIVATQRPSVDVITGLMKANIPGRIAFSVASVTDSRTILDCPGAEKLIGRGDMLFSTAALSKPVRIQGAFITEEEVKRVVGYLRGGETPVYDTSIVEKQKIGTASMFGGPADDQDPMFEEAKQAILEAGKASASFLQRRLKVGYARAARMLDELEEAGVIGPGDGAKPREILVTEFEIADTSMGLGQEANVYGESDDEDIGDIRNIRDIRDIGDMSDSEDEEGVGDVEEMVTEEEVKEEEENVDAEKTTDEESEDGWKRIP